MMKKRRIKFISMMVCAFLAVSIGLSCVSMGVSANESNDDGWSREDCILLANFVESNFDTFVLEYNAAHEDALYATHIEFWSLIYLMEDENYGVYIDFNGDNGYFVCTGDYNIYEMKVSGDLPDLRLATEIQYSYFDGFFFVDFNNVVQRYEKNRTPISDVGAGSAYDGQGKPGDGDISNIEAYVSDRYPSYTYYGEVKGISEGYTHFLQTETSFYLMAETDAAGNETDDILSESNCGLNSMGSLLHDWAKKGFLDAPYNQTVNVRPTIKSDYWYDEYITGEVLTGSGVRSASSGSVDFEYYKWIINEEWHLTSMERIYVDFRNYAIQNYNFSPESTYYTVNIPPAMEYVASLYDQSIDVQTTTTFSTVKDSLRSGKAASLTINGSSTYGDHIVALLGYRVYSYTSGWWIFATTELAYFYEISDGWEGLRYFDPNTSANPTLNYCILK